MGFALGEHHDAELAWAALAWRSRCAAGTVAGVVFHTDQGGEYTGGVFARGLPAGRGDASRWADRVGAGQRGRGIVQLHRGVRTVAQQPLPTREQARRAVAAGSTSTTRCAGTRPT